MIQLKEPILLIKNITLNHYDDNLPIVDDLEIKVTAVSDI